MADFASMIYGTANQMTSQDMGKQVQAGAQLALEKERLDQQQQQLQMQQQQLQTAKLEKLYSFMAGAHNYSNAADRNAYLANVPGYAAAMGLNQNVINKDALAGMGSDENTGKMYTLKTMVESGEITPDDYFTIIKDKQKLAEIPATPPEAIDLGKVDANPALKDAMERSNALKVASIRASATISPDKQLADFGKQVANPSSRSELGAAKQMVNAADAIKQLTEANVPPNATREQKIAAYNQLTPQQNTEVIRNMDRLLSRSNPTVHGQENLEPGTWAELQAKYGQKVLNTPQGANQGEFIANMVDTVNRERKLNADKFRTSAQSVATSLTRAKEVHGDTMNKIIEDQIKEPQSSYVSFNGKFWPRDKLQQLVEQNPNDPKAADARKALGGQ